MVFAPPFTALYSVHVGLSETPFKLAAQNICWELEGAYTGEVSGLFLKEVGCDYVIIGHSERRCLVGETDDLINKKVKAALASELIPILCVGETGEERRKGETAAVLERQLKRDLREVTSREMDPFVIAYEPVWAIGTGETATTEQAAEAMKQIRTTVGRLYDAPLAEKVRLLYGGSVKGENAGALLAQNGIDGLLVGGASLDARQFVEIVKRG